MEMKKSLILILSWLAMVMFASSARAVDRIPKTGDSEQKKETSEIKESKVKRSGEVTRESSQGIENDINHVNDPKKAETKSVEGKGKYDYFLDRNNNGIDDRLEGNLKNRETKKQEIIKKNISSPPEKTKPQITPVVKPKERVERQSTSEPKKDETPVKIEKKRGSEKK
jgi:hypothetical protein